MADETLKNEDLTNGGEEKTDNGIGRGKYGRRVEQVLFGTIIYGADGTIIQRQALGDKTVVTDLSKSNSPEQG